MPLEIEPPVRLAAYRTSLTTWVNGTKHEIAAADLNMTLLEWLRSIGLTGTKLGCGEGGCGACTVVVSSFDAAAGAPRHAAVNACLFPLCAVDWCAVTTIEGIGSTRKGLHPVQERMTEMHGSQCGFCTPGIVMAMYALFRTTPDLGVATLEEHMDGNLCRCTGYRPILDAGRSLCSDADRTPCGGGGGCGGGGCAAAAAAAAATLPRAPTTTAAARRRRARRAGRRACPADGRLVDGDVVSDGAGKAAVYRTPYSETAAAAAEPEFPSELRAPPSPLRVAAAAAGGGSWWKPTTLAELLLLRQAYPAARIVVGNTEVGIESRYKGRATDSFLCPTAVPELTACADGDDGMTLGAAASLADVEKLCGGAATARPGRRGEVARAVMAMLRWFASTQIRNAACLGGNLVTASPISDMNPMLAACGATLRVASAARGDRTVAVASFFKAYRTVDLAADEIVVSVHVPHAHEDAFVRPFKQARRREDASALSIAT